MVRKEPRTRRRIALVTAALAACLLAALLFPTAAQAAEAKRWIYIVSRGAPKADVAAEALLDRIDSAVLTGVRLGLGRPRDKRRFDDVQSYRRIADVERSTLDPLEKLSLYGARDLTKEIDRARQRLQTKDPISMVQVVVFRASAQSL